MRPSNLKCPFTWEKRHILIEDRVWYVPDRFDDFNSFSFPGWSHSSFFGNNLPICIEYCSGNGAWIAEKARNLSEYNWLGVEYQFERVRKMWSKIKNFNLSNLMAICGEGEIVTRQYIPSNSVKAVYVNFPDPWPKNRHAKNRIIKNSFIQEIERILQPEGTLTLVTDDEDYSNIMIQTLHKFPKFISLYKEPYYTRDYPDYGASYFEELWRSQNKIIRYHVYRIAK